MADLVSRIQWFETNLARQLGWIAAADKRAAFVFSLDTAMFGLVIAIVKTTKLEMWNVWAGVGLLCAILAGILSLVDVIRATFPQTTGPRGSMIFFGAIVKRTRSQNENTPSCNGPWCTSTLPSFRCCGRSLW